MIGKAKSISHTSNAIDYAKNKEFSIELNRNELIGETGRDMENEFKIYQNLNSNCRNNTISVVISPDIKDGQNLTNEDFKKISNDFLKEIKAQEHQHITYLHSDRNHKHLHIFINRIGKDGKALNDSFIGKKTQNIADNIAKENALIRAREKENIKNTYNKTPKKSMLEAHKNVMKQEPNTIHQYINLMEKENIKVKPTINKQGNVQGFTMEYKGKEFKASDIHREMSYNRIKEQFQAKEMSAEQKEFLSKTNEIMKSNEVKDFSEFKHKMNEKGINFQDFVNSNAVDVNQNKALNSKDFANELKVNFSNKLTPEDKETLKFHHEIIKEMEDAEKKLEKQFFKEQEKQLAESQNKEKSMTKNGYRDEGKDLGY